MIKKNYIGKRYGKLIISSVIGKKLYADRYRWFYLAKCDCGNYKEVDVFALSNNSSCGCEKINRIKNLNHKHGCSNKTPEYKAWIHMKERCYNPNSPRYNCYGRRGIKVDETWVNSFETFLKDMGTRPSNKHSLDRINVNGNYSKDNCRWADIRTQSLNKRNTLVFTVFGETLTLKDIAIKYNKNYKYLHSNIKYKNKSIEELIK